MCVAHMGDALRRSYGTKLILGYAITGGMTTLVGVVTGSVGAAVMMTWAGLLALGSITGTNTIASVEELEIRARDIAEGDLNTEIYSNRYDEFGSLFSAIDTMRGSMSDEIASSTKARSAAEQAQADAKQAEKEATQLATAYQQTAERYAETMQQVAGGDLTQRVDVDQDHRAMETIGREFNRAIDDLTMTLQAVAEFATNIQEDTDEITGLSDEVRAGMNEAVGTTDDITDNAR